MNLAVIPAGGKSTRMGCAKLMLPLGDKSVLEHVIAALRQAAIDPIVVVIGSHVPELVALAEKEHAQVYLLEHETADMRATVEHGLRWVEARFSPSAKQDNWLLAPADHPTLAAGIVRQLLKARIANPDRSIVIPTFQAKRGHPALIGWNHVAGIRAMPAQLGLNAYLRRQVAVTLELPVASADVLCDLDTPEDYQRLRRRWRDGSGLLLP
jgi:molybdenum cofactor cytidylyltransferase